MVGSPVWPDAVARLLRDDPPASDVHPALVLPPAQLAGRIQHALVGEAVTERQVRAHVREALEHGFDAAVVPPCWVWAARDEMRGTTGRVGSFIDYPHGSSTTAGRVGEAASLVDAGVDELDCTVNVGYLLSSRLPEFAADLAAVVRAAAPVGVKLMLELPLLDARRRERAVQAAVDAGAAFVVNASRGAVGIADPSTVSYLRRSVPPSIGVKAAGGIKTIEQVRAVLAAGADLVGTAAGVQIVTGRGQVPGSLYSY
ncbi:deoxyribose-phosphate aldolase [Nakamurella endophytica]|uniref:Deoxyribose-phosphate aldolase n=1 Tax=Nakamurella endophytica TaxID=1748367 RepID=A0A917SUD1_9ACTN|nr:deoxyribose-phosphate aldolase [Nakamurella endophytica]GGL96569.1 deoxyribose-phosphate aldolase [Nakamurella endophytica]